MDHTLIDPQEAQERARRGARLVDVRTPAEFAAAHAPGALNLPLERLEPAALARDRQWGPAEPLLVLCEGTTRATMAAERLAAGGFTGVVVIAGGTKAWIAAGLPVERRGRAMSLERQVRIGAGSLVLVGCALGTWVHPGLYGIAAFVGAGLVFAGVTDFCGMAIVLARMPWNRAPRAEAACAAAG